MLKEVIINENDTSLVESVTNDKGESEPITRKRVIKTHTYMRNILNKAEQRCELLPKNCRLVQSNGPQTFFVIEQQPEIRPVRFNYDFNRELSKIKSEGVIDYTSIQKLININGQNMLKLAFPYIVFLISIKDHSPDRWECKSFRVFFRMHQIKRMNDYLFIANLLNLSDRNSLCFGGGVVLDKNRLSLSEAAEKLVNEFWIRPFRYEYESRHVMYKNTSILNNFLLWAYYTQKDPMFIYSAKWLLHDRNIGQELNAMLLETDSTSTQTRFSSFFIDTAQPSTNSPKEINFETLRLNDRILTIGDQLTYNDKKLFVYNFIGDRDGPTHIVFIDEKGNELEPIQITSALKLDWNKQIENQLNNYVNVIKLGEDEIKVGDIIRIVSTNMYEIVKNIRISRDSLVELECGGKFYIAREGNIKPVKSVDTNGIELNPNTEYIICDTQLQHGYTGRMSNIRNNGSNNLIVYFKDNVTNIENGISINALEEKDVLIFPQEDDKIRELSTFRYMNKLYNNNDNRYLIVKNCGVYDRRGNENEQFIHLFDRTTILRDILNADKTTLSIPGIDKDINFTVGEKVVVGDWDQPNELMFKIREIVGFVVEHNKLLFQLKYSDDDIVNVEYINLDSGSINVGYIRKVVSEYNNIPVETYIIANQAGIHNFPKKDRNKIAAFIIDSDEPLILFHSGLTMWYSDLEQKFDLIIPGTPEHNKIRKFRTLDVNTIDWQSGDLCVNTNNHYLLNNDNPYMGIVYMQIHSDFVKSGSLRSRARVSNEIDPSFKRYGIIDPRYAKKDSIVEYENIPNFHNGYYKTSTDGYYPYTIRRMNNQ